MSGKPTWILVADASRAFALANSAAPDKFEQVADFRFEGFRGRDADLGTDRPVRTHALSGRTAGSATSENGELAKIEHRRFLREVIAQVEKRRRAGEFERLILVAPPRALGILRVALSDELAETVILEIAADHTRTPPHEIGPKILPLLRP